MRSLSILLLATAVLAILVLSQDTQDRPDEGFVRVHMDISCTPYVGYVRALERFNQVLDHDSGFVMAYWGAAMIYNHPFWDPPSQADETAAWALVQRGLSGVFRRWDGACFSANRPRYPPVLVAVAQRRDFLVRLEANTQEMNTKFLARNRMTAPRDTKSCVNPKEPSAPPRPSWRWGDLSGYPLIFD